MIPGFLRSIFNWFGPPETAAPAPMPTPAPGKAAPGKTAPGKAPLARTVFAALDTPDAMVWIAPKTLKAMQAMERFSPLGRRLLDWAKAEKVSFTEAPDQIDPWLAGTQWGNNVALNPANAEGFNIPVIAHEIMHAVQRKADLLHHKLAWDLRGRILNVLFREAASEVCAAIVHYECAKGGYVDPDPDAWAPQRGVYDTYAAVYDMEIGDGQDTETAHAVAATQAHAAYFASHGMTRSYINKEIVQYMRDVVDGSLKKHTPFSGLGLGWGGRLTEFADVALVEHPVMPVTDGELLYNDPALIHMVDYLELHRLWDSAQSGPRSFATQKLLRACMAKGNPFLNVVPADALAEYDRRKAAPGGRPDIGQVLCDLAGLKPTAQLSFDFSGPAPVPEPLQPQPPAL